MDLAIFPLTLRGVVKTQLVKRLYRSVVVQKIQRVSNMLAHLGPMFMQYVNHTEGYDASILPDIEPKG